MNILFKHLKVFKKRREILMMRNLIKAYHKNSNHKFLKQFQLKYLVIYVCMMRVLFLYLKELEMVFIMVRG